MKKEVKEVKEDTSDLVLKITAAAEAAKRDAKEEGDALLVLLEKTGPLLLAVPPKVVWKYSYHGYKRSGVTSARYVHLQSQFRRLTISYGPTADFIQNSCDFDFLRKKMGGLAPILLAIRAAQTQQATQLTDGRVQALNEIKASTEVQVA